MIEKSSHTALYALDDKIRGPYLPSARDFGQLSGDPREAAKLARNRIAAANGAFMEIAGGSLATTGLAERSSVLPFIIGTGLIMSGAFLRTHARARSGAQWEQLLERTVDGLGLQRPDIEAALIDRNIPPADVGSLRSLPRAIYRAEGYHPTLSNAKFVGTALGSGLGMEVEGNEAIGVMIQALCLASIVSGARFHRSSMERATQFRLARTAGHDGYRQELHKSHARMSDKINAGANVPNGLIALNHLLPIGNFVQSVYGINLGLGAWLSTAMNLEVQREEALRSTEITKQLIEIITKRPFISTDRRWKEHVSEAEALVFKPPPFEKGIIIEDFVAQSPRGDAMSLAPITMEVPAKGAAILRAKSGSGKSATMMGIMHVLEHKGSVSLVKNWEVTDVHKLSGPKEIAEQIVYITRDGINGLDTLVDFFKGYFIEEEYHDLYKSHLDKYNKMDVEVAWRTADNQLKAEIEKGEKGRYSSAMRHDLAEMREKRNTWVRQHLIAQGGNLADEKITPDRVFDTLSEGEQQRLLVAIAEKAAQVRERTAIILDEPLANLDHDEEEQGGEKKSDTTSNKTLQIEALRHIQEDHSVALIIISHNGIDDLKAGLKHWQIINPSHEPLATSSQ